MKTYKNSEEFAKELMQTLGTESPSKDFVKKVMGTIRAENPAPIIYKPLISKLGWLLIGVLTALLIFLLLNGSSDFSNIFADMKIDLFAGLNIDLFGWLNSLEIFNNIKISKLFAFSFVLFTVLVMFQLTVIKNYFNRQYDVNF